MQRHLTAAPEAGSGADNGIRNPYNKDVHWEILLLEPVNDWFLVLCKETPLRPTRLRRCSTNWQRRNGTTAYRSGQVMAERKHEVSPLEEQPFRGATAARQLGSLAGDAPRRSPSDSLGRRAAFDGGPESNGNPVAFTPSFCLASSSPSTSQTRAKTNGLATLMIVNSCRCPWPGRSAAGCQPRRCRRGARRHPGQRRIRLRFSPPVSERYIRYASSTAVWTSPQATAVTWSIRTGPCCPYPCFSRPRPAAGRARPGRRRRP